MNSVVQEKEFRLDWLKWSFILALGVAAIYANWYYSAESALFRAIGLLFTLFICALIASRTKHGVAAIDLAMGSRTEWRKVVWPSSVERNQTTLIVVAVIILTALILWGIDSLLSWLASIIMG
jgi:preprotein translocase subunit SecE